MKQKTKKEKEIDEWNKKDIQQSQRKYKQMLERFRKTKHISIKNKKTMEEFESKLSALDIEPITITRYYQFFWSLFKFYKKDILKANRTDIENIVKHINNNPKLQPSSKFNNKQRLKRFFKIMLGKDEDYPDNIKWLKIKIKLKDRKKINPEELITPEDIDKLIKVAKFKRDRAIISTLWESGCRISELGDMTVGSVIFDEYGCLINLKGKTGRRQVRLTTSTKYLKDYLKTHIYKDKPDFKDKPIWVAEIHRNKGSKLMYVSFSAILKRLFKLAGIEKRTNPHNLRHSRATELAKHLSDDLLCNIFGWKTRTMVNIYCHTTDKDSNNALLKLNGISVSENTFSKEPPKNDIQQDERQEFLKWKEEQEFKKWKEMKQQKQDLYS